ncbi:sugar transferase [Actinopolymorpha pittospori]|uniref:Lipopolysaccharide/colanic/teichoic acid biosynthesis glycosyltransferase n=1 Tax=Actinopolymorpha pittospori TaxID=648752 RepID=A0A927NBG0_9ACTN|nr:sugar transferase [Actinopolymorpha pittospori]MBE1612447.1 lipopolysaccharide/colanic/teichoic acid biosynthesis glycosyltransferase [Actinopolymorpha pittospori]
MIDDQEPAPVASAISNNTKAAHGGDKAGSVQPHHHRDSSGSDVLDAQPVDRDGLESDLDELDSDPLGETAPEKDLLAPDQLAPDQFGPHRLGTEFLGTATSPPLSWTSRRFTRRPRAVVIEGPEHSAGTDRLEEELDIVARLCAPPDLASLREVLARWRPKMLLLKSSLDEVDYWLLTSCIARRVQVWVLARPAYGLLGSTSLHRFGGVPWLQLRWPGQDLWAASVKRGIDLALTLLLAPLLLPLMLVVAAAICVDGSPLYFQERVGLGGRRFRLVKFRTMRKYAEHDTGPVLATPGDPRLTPLGHLLRRLRIDELPQLWNILRGDMSLVGPRPERPELIRTFDSIPHYDLRHLIRPGLTGIAQLTGGYGAGVEDKLRCDLLYVACRSLRLDLKLLGLTFRELLRGFPRG